MNKWSQSQLLPKKSFKINLKNLCLLFLPIFFRFYAAVCTTVLAKILMIIDLVRKTWKTVPFKSVSEDRVKCATVTAGRREGQLRMRSPQGVDFQNVNRLAQSC